MRVVNHLTVFSGNQLGDIFFVILKQLFVAEQNLRVFAAGSPPGRKRSGCSVTASETLDGSPSLPSCDFTEAGLKTS